MTGMVDCSDADELQATRWKKSLDYLGTSTTQAEAIEEGEERLSSTRYHSESILFPDSFELEELPDSPTFSALQQVRDERSKTTMDKGKMPGEFESTGTEEAKRKSYGGSTEDPDHIQVEEEVRTIDSLGTGMGGGRSTTPRNSAEASNSSPARISTEVDETESLREQTGATSSLFDSNLLGYLFPGEGTEFDETESASSTPFELSSDRSEIKIKTSSIRKGRVRSGKRVMSLQGILGDAISTSASIEGDVEVKMEAARKLSKHEVWYFLRVLIREELECEGGQLWQLRDLDLSAMRVEESLSHNSSPNFASKELPILRYLIRNFLVTIPLIRDVISIDSTTKAPAFWYNGLRPLLIALHSADLSHEDDTGSPGPISQLRDSVMRALERFVSAGLKVERLEGKSTSTALEPLLHLNFGADAEAISQPATPTLPSSPALLNSTYDQEDSDLPPLPPLPQPLPVPASNRSAGQYGAPAFLTAISRSSELDSEEAEGIRPDSHADLMMIPNFESAIESNTAQENEEQRGSAFIETTEDTSDSVKRRKRLDIDHNRGVGVVRPYVVGQDFDPSSNFELFPSTTKISTNAVKSSAVTFNTTSENPLPSLPPDTRRDSNEIIKKKFGFGSLLRLKRSEKSPPPTVAKDPHFPSSRRTPSSGSVTFAASNLPPSAPSIAPISAPLDLEVVEKSGIEWPMGEKVMFWRGVKPEQLLWGGFEADVVGVKKGLAGHTFLIRVRRPQRLDEYVARNENQFVKYFKVLERQYPGVHVRRIPTTLNPSEEVAHSRNGSGSLNSNQSISTISEDGKAGTRRGRAATLEASVEIGSPVRTSSALRKASPSSEDPEFVPGSSTSAPTAEKSTPGAGPTSILQSKGQSPNKLVRSLKSQSIILSSPPSTPRRVVLVDAGRSYSVVHTEEDAPGSTSADPDFSSPKFSEVKKIPAFDAQRRALRGWLRDTLAIRTVGQHNETAAFLLLGSIVPKPAEVKDFRERAAIDEARRLARAAVAEGSCERAKTMKSLWDSVREDCIYGDGSNDISRVIKNVALVEKLPEKYLKSIEWLRFGVAETLYDLLVSSESSGSTFRKVKALHANFPYFLVRQAFKLPKSKQMAGVLQDILLARPFGGKSLLQKILATTLDDDPEQMQSQINGYRNRVGSQSLTDKLDIFVASSREKKEAIRNFAKANRIELVAAIVRGGEEPRIPTHELQRVIRAAESYRMYMKQDPTPLAKSQCTNSGIRLILDMQMYLRLISKERDARMIRKALGEESTVKALEVVVAPFVDFLKRVYKIGDAAKGLSDFQKALDQLIIIIEALRSRIQEPQKAIRIIARYLARQQQPLYEFIRAIHKGEIIVEELLQWGWTAGVFLRRGLAKAVDLDAVLPTDPAAREELLEEIEDLVEYHEEKRSKQYQDLCRRCAGDVDIDDPIIVEGDGAGKSKVEPILEKKPKMPRLVHIPVCLDALRTQLRRIFAV